MLARKKTSQHDYMEAFFEAIKVQLALGFLTLRPISYSLLSKLKIKSGGTSPGSSHLTAVAYAKRDEASKTFSSSSPFADFDSETWKLAVLSDGIPKKQNPMIFEPGDPRIAAAIADMKFDPNEVFKPRPGSELEFLDPLELEVEHFKR